VIKPPVTAFAVTVRADKTATAALVSLAGEIDMAAVGALADAADHLSSLAPAEVIVDLDEVTFACSTLSNFLERVHLALPPGTTLTLCRPTHNTRWVLQATGMEKISTLRAELPESRPYPAAASGRRFAPRTRSPNSVWPAPRR
jgi:anti-anti-sigma factor